MLTLFVFQSHKIACEIILHVLFYVCYTIQWVVTEYILYYILMLPQYLLVTI